MGRFYDPETDNTVDVYIKFGDSASSEKFKFVSYDDQTGEAIRNECDQSADLLFLSFTEGLLLLSNQAGSQYYACIYQPDPENLLITRKDIQYPQFDDLLPFSEFVPYYFDDVAQKLFVAVRKETSLNFYSYNIATSMVANKVGNYYF